MWMLRVRAASTLLFSCSAACCINGSEGNPAAFQRHMELAGGASVYSREALKFNAGTGSYARLQEVYRQMGGAVPSPASPPDAGPDGAQQQVASDDAVLHRASNRHDGAPWSVTCEADAAGTSPGAQQSRASEAADTVTGVLDLEASDAAAEHGMFATRFPPHPHPHPHPHPQVSHLALIWHHAFMVPRRDTYTIL